MAVAIEADLPTITALMAEVDADGLARTRLSGIYAAASDAKAVELGIDDPARFREG